MTVVENVYYTRFEQDMLEHYIHMLSRAGNDPNADSRSVAEKFYWQFQAKVQSPQVNNKSSDRQGGQTRKTVQ